MIAPETTDRLKRRLRTRIALLLLATALALAAAIAALLQWHHARQIQQQQGSLDTVAQAIDRHIFSHFQQAAQAIGRHPETIALVNGERDRDAPEVVLLLTCARDLLGADLAYVMDGTGTVAACSPYDDGKTLTGKNYRFRPYFSLALSGRPTFYPALGVTTNKRGLYISVPLNSSPNEGGNGVVVIKVGLEAIDALLEREAQGRHLALLSPSGIVFAATTPSWLFHAARPLSEDARLALIQDRQFGNASLNPLPHALDRPRLAMRGRQYDVVTASITLEGWQIVALAPVRTPWDSLLGLLLLAGALVALFIVRMSQHLQRQGLQEEISQQNRELKRINEQMQREIDERQRAEIESQQHRTMHEAVLDNSCDAMLLLENGCFIDCNDTALSLFGLRREELLQSHPWDLSPPRQEDGRDSQELAGKMIEHTVNVGRNQFEWLHQRWDGTVFPAEVLLTLVSFEKRQLIHAVVRDISVQKEEEALLRLFKRAVAQSSDGIVITDLQGVVLFGNQAWADMHDYTLEELAGLPIGNFLDNESTAPGEFDISLWRHGAAGSVEQWHSRRDNASFPALISCTPILNNRQEPAAYLVIARDITERFEAELELHRAKEAAEAASKAKSDFLANMSHEIRTPMNGIIGLTGLLLKTPLAADQQSKLRLVASSADRLMDIINNILDFSKIEAGRVELEAIEFTLDDEIAGLLSVMFVKTKEKGLILRYEPDESLPARLIGDSTRLLQILTNLLNNAIKFTREGKIVLEAALDRTEGDRAWIRFSVRDSGIGIPLEKQGLIFEAFSQADTSHTRKYGGTGLGLSICAQLCELMGGNIGLMSSEGMGSTFWCLLPFRLPHVAIRLEEDTPVQQLASPRSREDILGGVRVLLAEDEFINTTLAVALLEQVGLQVATAGNGREAVEAWEREKPAVILMDIQMPEMDGYQATARIRELEKEGGGHIPIIAMTAHAMQGDRAKCLLAGMDDYVTKPIDPELLCQALERQLVPTALVVDDHPVSQRIASQILVSLGWRVSLASTGPQALAASETASYSLILMDIQMPEMDGLEVTRRIRQQEQATGKRCRIIAVSSQEDGAASCLEAGMNDFIAKPLTAEKLTGALKDKNLKRAD